MEPINNLQLTDQELDVLSNILRNYKLDLTSEQTLLVAMGKQKHPVLELTVKVSQLLEARVNELKAQAQTAPGTAN